MAEAGVSLTDVHLKVTLIYTPSPPSTAPHLPPHPPPEETPGIYSNDTSPSHCLAPDQARCEPGGWLQHKRGGLLWTRMELDGASVNSGSQDGSTMLIRDLGGWELVPGLAQVVCSGRGRAAGK